MTGFGEGVYLTRLGRGLLWQDWNLRAKGSSEDRGGVKYVHLLRVAGGSGDTRRCPRSAKEPYAVVPLVRICAGDAQR